MANKQFHFRGSPALLRSAHDAGGLDVVTVANNHSGDYGSVALLDTIRYAHAAGLETVGGGINAAAALRPVIVKAGGLRIGFVGLSDVNPYGFNATADSPGTAKADPDTVAAAVRAARRQADVVVCWFHWGTELHPGPSERQQQLAAAALNAGAQVVLGAHPHVFGAVSSPTRALGRRVDARELRLPRQLGRARRAPGSSWSPSTATACAAGASSTPRSTASGRELDR